MSKKITAVLAGIAALPLLILGIPALAQEVPTGQFEGGNIYRVANLTKNIDFTDPVAATCGDTVQFRVRVHNIGAFPAENVKISATLPGATGTSHSSTVTLSSRNTNTVTDTAGVNLDKAGKLTYVAGSTELLDANQAKLGNLADGIIAGGVTLPDPVGVSTQQKRSVQFQAKVTCETPPVDITVCELATKKIIVIKENQFDAIKHSRDLSKCADTPPTPGNITVCEISTGKVITIKENEFDASKHSKDLNRCAPTPVVPGTTTPGALPDTGAGEIVALFASVVAGAMIAYRVVWLRR